MDKTHEKKLIESARQLALGQKQAERHQSVQVSGFDLSCRLTDSAEEDMILGETAGMDSVERTFESFRNGMRINQYRILKKIGEGGMGEVFLAQHVKFKSRLFAIKFLRRDLVNAATRDRFEAEISAMEVLNHDNLVYAHDAGEFEGSTYLVMDYVEGKSIKAFAMGDPLRISNAAEIIRQTALGLQNAHENGLVHRDIKPSNLMLSTAGVVKILDMGLAKITEPTTQQLTHSQQVLGTPDYMAPEQWQNTRDVDIRADIYSLGCTFYYLLAGHAPYEDEEHSSLATKLSGHLKEPPPEIPSLSNDNRFEQTDLVLKKMLEKDPAARYQTPDEVAKALEPFCVGSDLQTLTSDFEPVAIPNFDTRSIQDELEDTQTKMPATEPLKSESEGAEQGRRSGQHWLNAVAISVLVLIGIVYLAETLGFFESADTNNSTGSASSSTTLVDQAPSRANAMDAPHFSVSYISRANLDLPADHPEQDLQDEGMIGVTAFTAKFGDLVKVHFRLDQPRYVYLIALNPTEDPKYKIQLCYPSTDKDPPKRLSELTYPKLPNTYFPMTDGIGQLAFVLIKSESPLPNFGEWKKTNLGKNFPWQVSRQTGVWLLNENGELERKVQKIQRTFRGDVVQVNSSVLSQTLEYLQSKPVEVEVLAFPVLSD